jgi:hypothetical protein
MLRLIIMADLAETSVAPFAGAELVLCIPASKDEYATFYADEQGMYQAVAMLPGVVAKMQHPDTSPAELAEGLRILAGLTEQMQQARERSIAFLSRIEALAEAVTVQKVTIARRETLQ